MKSPSSGVALRSWIFDFLPAAFMDFSFYVSYSTIQYVLHQQEVPANLLATTFSAYAAAYVIACPSLAALAGRRRRVPLLAGLILALSIVALLPFAESLLHYQILLALYAIAAALFWPSFQMVISGDGEVRELPRRLAIFNLGWTLGKACGVLAAGSFRELGLDPRLAFLLAFGLIGASLGLFCARRFPSEPPRAAEPLDAEQPKLPPSRARAYFLGALAANFFVWGSQTAVISLIPELGKRLGFGAFFGGLLLATLIAGEAIMFAVLDRWRGWIDRAGPIAWAPAAAALALALLPLGAFAPYALGAALVLGSAVAVSYSLSLLYAISGQSGSLRAGVHEAALGMGSFLIPLVLGQAIVSIDLGPALHALAAAYAIAALVLFAALRRVA